MLTGSSALIFCILIIIFVAVLSQALLIQCITHETKTIRNIHVSQSQRAVQIMIHIPLEAGVRWLGHAFLGQVVP